MTSQDKPLALVTGASRGIGKGIAELLVARGYRVLGTATSEKGVAELRALLQSQGDEHDALLLNIADAEQVKEAILALLEHFGTPQVVV